LLDHKPGPNRLRRWTAAATLIALATCAAAGDALEVDHSITKDKGCHRNHGPRSGGIKPSPRWRIRIERRDGFTRHKRLTAQTLGIGIRGRLRVEPVPFVVGHGSQIRGEVRGKILGPHPSRAASEAIRADRLAPGDRLDHHPGEFPGGGRSCDGFSSWGAIL